MSVPTEKRVKTTEGLILFLFTCCCARGLDSRAAGVWMGSGSVVVGIDPEASFPSLLSCCRRGVMAEKRGRRVARRRGRGGRVRTRGRIFFCFGGFVSFVRGFGIRSWFVDSVVASSSMLNSILESFFPTGSR